MQVNNDVLYYGIANQPSPPSLYLSDFLSFHSLNDNLFVKDFCKTVLARVIIFGWCCWFGFSGPLRQYFGLYRAVSQRGGERGEK